VAEPRLKAPFPFFGGKSRACPLIHSRLGDCPGYIEPFAGSLAYLLSKAPSRYETVNDLDNYIANFWRAVRAVDARVRVRELEAAFGRKVRLSGPAAVAFYADWPVNEADLTARHRWLMSAWRKYKFRERMLCEPDYFDAKVAGYWVWGISCWIGAGWCDERSEWNGPGREGNRGRAMHQDPKRPCTHFQGGIDTQGVRSDKLRDPWVVMPFVAGDKTVHKQPSATPEMMVQSERGPAGVRPDLASDGKGVHAPWQKRPHLMSHKGTHGGDTKMPHIRRHQGVSQAVPEGRPHLKRPYELHKPPAAKRQNLVRCFGTHQYAARNEALLDWMNRLADRLRYVRVCCGDWRRIMGKAVRTAASPCAILLDPPYSAEADRDEGIYAHEDTAVAHDVCEWCVEHGGDTDLRIALCGYEGEGHDVLVNDHGWTVESWKASGGYGRIHGDKAGRSLVNRHRERIYFSPGCIPAGNALPPGSALFAEREEQTDG